MIAKNRRFSIRPLQVLETIAPVIDSNPAYEKAGILERLTEPDRAILFKVPWVDDSGKVRVSKGYRDTVQQRHRPRQRACLRLHPLSIWA